MLLKENHISTLSGLNPKLISEMKANNDGRLILKNKLIQYADKVNKNGRIYPRAVLNSAVSEYINKFVRINNAIGELDHPDDSSVSLQRGAINLLDIFWRGNELRADIEVLNHIPNGKILEGYLMHNITVGISSRAEGSVEEINSSEGTIIEVKDDLELIAWDVVKDPSTHSAYITESISGKQKNDIQIIRGYTEIEQIISNILF